MNRDIKQFLKSVFSRYKIIIRYFPLTVFGCIVFLPGLFCTNSDASLKEGEKLARIHCASCHAFPDPNLLDKKTWANEVLPKMAEMMFVDTYYNPYSPSGPGGDVAQTRIMPADLFPFEKFNKIYRYYTSHAPEFPLERRESLSPVQQGLNSFEVHSISDKVQTPLTTLVKIDSAHKKFYWGDGKIGRLFCFAPSLQAIDSFDVLTGIADLYPDQKGIFILTMGILKPSDERLGKLTYVDKDKKNDILIDSLNRPVHASFADLNGDARKDIVLCEFGFRLGGLSWFEKKENGQFEKHMLRALPGAVRSEVFDFNRDGLPDIVALMAQGDEGLFIYYNQGNGKFTEERIMQFPPTYGSDYFQLCDFNNDGWMDIITCNGDNGDYTLILKPYHGIRIFLNDGKNQFKERIFLPVHGVQKTMPADFDKDGDIDLISIAFFPDYEKHPEESFIYWENSGDFHYSRHSFPGALDGRWMTMDVGDVDGDSDEDILLGNAFFQLGNLPKELKFKWNKQSLSITILKNRMATKR
jgi:hypothetical protein